MQCHLQLNLCRQGELSVLLLSGGNWTVVQQTHAFLSSLFLFGSVRTWLKVSAAVVLVDRAQKY